MNIQLLDEALYLTLMEQKVEPYLEDRSTVHWLTGKRGDRIFCQAYLTHLETPLGVVVISHGFTESAAKYREVAWYFLNNGYHVYIPEHCGHGHSTRLVEDTSLVYIDSYDHYIDNLLQAAHFAYDQHPGLPRFLFAHSMGGGIGAAAFGREPELFQRIILTSPMLRPLTGGVPFPLASAIASAACLLGSGKGYVFGQKPYSGPEVFEESASLSRPRFEYYQRIKASQPMYQNSAASFSWLLEASRMSREILTRSYKAKGAPILLFQAEQDVFVAADAQEAFVQKRNQLYPGSTTLVHIPNTKHEIYSSTNDVLLSYWSQIFDFLACQER